MLEVDQLKMSIHGMNESEGKNLQKEVVDLLWRTTKDWSTNAHLSELGIKVELPRNLPKDQRQQFIVKQIIKQIKNNI